MLYDEAYHGVEKKIEETRRSGRRSLYIKGLGLTDLPDSLKQLRNQLKSLDLSNNELSTLPNLLGQFTKLES